jgi:hypothetical protein
MVKKVYLECLRREPTSTEIQKYKTSSESTLRNAVCVKTTKTVTSTVASSSVSTSSPSSSSKGAVDLTGDIINQGIEANSDVIKDGTDIVKGVTVDLAKDAIRDTKNLVTDDIGNISDFIKKPTVKSGSKVITDNLKNIVTIGKNFGENYFINPIKNTGKMISNLAKNTKYITGATVELGKKTFNTTVDVNKEVINTSIKLVRNFYVETPVKVVKSSANIVVDNFKDSVNFVKKPSVANATKVVTNTAKNVLNVGKETVNGMIVKPISIVSNAVSNVTSSVKKFFGGGSSRKPLMSEEEARVLAAQLYKDELKRTADSAGLANYTNVIMWDGLEKARISIRDTAEYQGLNSKSSLQTFTSAQKKDAEARVRSVWSECFGRKPTSNELSAFTLRFLSRPESIEQEIANICNSPGSIKSTAK